MASRRKTSRRSKRSKTSRRRSRRSKRSKTSRRRSRRRSSRRRSSRRRSSKSKKRLNTPLKKWNKAVKMHGYMKKGNFKLVPKKGTKAYNEIRKTYEQM